MKLSIILEGLKTAPAGHLSEEWRNRCINFKGSDEEILKLFEEIYNTSDMETSQFVRTLVNPKYTKEYL